MYHGRECGGIGMHHGRVCGGIGMHHGRVCGGIGMYHGRVRGYRDVPWQRVRGYRDAPWQSVRGYWDAPWQSVRGYWDVPWQSAGVSGCTMAESAGVSECTMAESAGVLGCTMAESAGVSECTMAESAGVLECTMAESAGVLECTMAESAGVLECTMCSQVTSVSHGTHDAVVILERFPFQAETVSSLLTNQPELKLQLKNDIYSVYHLNPPPELNEIKHSHICQAVIFPSGSGCCLRPYLSVRFGDLFNPVYPLLPSTEGAYGSLVLNPSGERQRSICWVAAILPPGVSAETGRPVPELGFCVVADIRWDPAMSEVEDLYLIAICHPRGIKSLRDLTSDHLPLLRNILREGQEAILKRYGIHGNQLRIYLHYQPSYYHLHVHFTALGHDAPGISVDRAHLLCDVIQNLECNPQYYKTRTLTYALRAGEELLEKYRAAGKC
ncbi:m7 diphosphatase [Pelobates cultripes]|uniref:m7GpppX diphosphatase n=1 Tax=Pelobates cultripes TaxID=61616 RepID=A0AAD1WRT7_PELCU|nr:m7 diphosphatase [Pelobates cultripes]